LPLPVVLVVGDPVGLFLDSAVGYEYFSPSLFPLYVTVSPEPIRFVLDDVFVCLPSGLFLREVISITIVIPITM
jgi:hypothetical protein